MRDLESAEREAAVPHHDGVVLVREHAVEQRRENLLLQLDVDGTRQLALHDVVQASGAGNLDHLRGAIDRKLRRGYFFLFKHSTRFKTVVSK